MMTTYAKLTDGVPQYLTRVPNVSNATEQQLAVYAAVHGYKPFGRSDYRGMYYDTAYEELPDAVRQFYIPWELGKAKVDAKTRVQQELTATLSSRVIIPCPGFPSGIVYDDDALTNAAGMSAGDSYIDADDNVTELTEETLQAVRAALKAHRMGLYAAATLKRKAIAAAESVDEVEATLNS